MLSEAARILSIDVRSGRLEPLRAIDHGLLTTRTRAAKASNCKIVAAGKNSRLIKTSMISLDQTTVIATTGTTSIPMYRSAS
ncbi:MAG: hypothetical protein COC13_00610 [Methanobacteriota archaeon]|nr:MAG: hypothetical protein COC13_00610 [Euryarchaeota archaeon]